MRQLSRLSVAYPTLLAFPNRQPSYLLSRMHHSRHLLLVLRSTQGKIMHGFLHYRAQRVYSVSPTTSTCSRAASSAASCRCQPVYITCSAPVQLGQTSGPYTRATPPPDPPRGGLLPPPGPYVRATPPPGHIHSTPIWAICSSTQPRSTYRTFPASQDRTHRPNRRKGNPVLDLDLLSRLWIEHSQCEGHHPLIPTLHKNPLSRAQRTGGPPPPKYRECSTSSPITFTETHAQRKETGAIFPSRHFRSITFCRTTSCG